MLHRPLLGSTILTLATLVFSTACGNGRVYYSTADLEAGAPDASDAGDAGNGCPEGHFRETPTQACQPYSHCEPGSYVSFGGSPTTDRTCTACPSGAFSTSRDQAACVPWKACEAGMYISVPGTAKSDRDCKACATGSYTATTDATNCSAWTTCKPGTYVTTRPSASVNRGCAECEAGTYSMQDNQSQCQAQSACPAGTLELVPATGSTLPQCETCPAGFECAGGKSPRVPCAVDDWDNDENAATPCVPKSVCAAGTFVTSSGTTVSDRACTACASGSFSATINSQACSTWTTCPAGTHIKADGTPSSDRVCESCPAGTSSKGNTASCSTCPAGTYSSAGATTCTTCPAGTYSDAGASSCSSICVQPKDLVTITTNNLQTVATKVMGGSLAETLDDVDATVYSASVNASGTPCSVSIAIKVDYRLSAPSTVTSIQAVTSSWGGGASSGGGGGSAKLVLNFADGSTSTLVNTLTTTNTTVVGPWANVASVTVDGSGGGGGSGGSCGAGGAINEMRIMVAGSRLPMCGQ